MVFLKLRCGGLEINSNNDIQGVDQLKKTRGEKTHNHKYIIIISFGGPREMERQEYRQYLSM